MLIGTSRQGYWSVLCFRYKVTIVNEKTSKEAKISRRQPVLSGRCPSFVHPVSSYLLSSYCPFNVYSAGHSRQSQSAIVTTRPRGQFEVLRELQEDWVSKHCWS